jgi:hypothetical protein
VTTPPTAPATATATVIRTVSAVIVPWQIVSAVPATAVIITRRVIRAVATTAVIVSRLDLSRGDPTQSREAHAGSKKGREAQHGLPPCQRALCFVDHRTPACT